VAAHLGVDESGEHAGEGAADRDGDAGPQRARARGGGQLRSQITYGRIGSLMPMRPSASTQRAAISVSAAVSAMCWPARKSTFVQTSASAGSSPTTVTERSPSPPG